MSPAGPPPLIEERRSTKLEQLRLTKSGQASFMRAGKRVRMDVADAVCELMGLGWSGVDMLIRMELQTPKCRAYMNAILGGSKQAYAHDKYYFRPGEVAAVVVSFELSGDGWVVRLLTLPNEHDPFEPGLAVEDALQRIDNIAAAHTDARSVLRCLHVNESLRQKMAQLAPDRRAAREELLAYLAAH